MPKKVKIGALLVDKGIIDAKQLRKVLAQQKKTGKKFGETLIELGFVKEKTLLEFLSEQLQIPIIDLASYEFDSDLTRKLSEPHSRRFNAILLKDEGSEYLVGMVDPLDLFATDELSRELKKPLKLAFVRSEELSHTLDLIYRRTEEISGYAEELGGEMIAGKTDLGQEIDGKADAPVVKLLESLFEDAVQVNASDIHIEPDENVLRIRQRVDGILQESLIKETHIAAALSQRLKLMAGLDIAEKRLPQDGRFNIKVRGMPIDVRLSTMPIQDGESIVMRLLNQKGDLLSLTDIGMSDDMLEQFRKFIKRPYGLFLVTGPTGSGKSTTLAGTLQELNDVGKKIITIEDPVEYRISRLNQVQVHPKIGLTFVNVLRAALRQDPDIILVGEIRDSETAEVALRAALTGHLVLATLHTQDAASTAFRLLDMGVESFLVAATLRAVLAQRLMRLVCDGCSEPYTPSDHELAWAGGLLSKEALGKATFHKGKGCTYCSKTGYRGRTGVFEYLELTPEMIEALRIGDSTTYAASAKKHRESQTLLDHAISLACEGKTTLAEVLRVAGEVE